MPKQYRRISEFVFGTPWGILPEKMAEIVQFIGRKNFGVDVDDTLYSGKDQPCPIAHYGKGETLNGRTMRAVVAVMPLHGTIVQRANMFTKTSGGTSCETFSLQFKDLLANDEISAIVIECDSPGGSVFGVHELANEIFNARGKKPIIAAVNSLCASAAYWIASACDEIAVTPSGAVGSVGVFVAHEDWSEWAKKEGVAVSYIHAGAYKVEGNPFQPLSEEARARLQAEVDNYYEMFTGDVARFRGVSIETVKADFGQGRVLNAQEMLQAGGIDRIETFAETLSRTLRATAAPAGAAAAKFKLQAEQLQCEIDCLELDN